METQSLTYAHHASWLFSLGLAPRSKASPDLASWQPLLDMVLAPGVGSRTTQEKVRELPLELQPQSWGGVHID